MKTFYTKIRFFTLLIAIFSFGLSACQKEDPVSDMTAEVVGNYQGEYREGDDEFTVIVSNVEGTAVRSSDDAFDMELELVPGLFSINFTARMESSTTFSVDEFELDGDYLVGDGTLEGKVLKITFYETGTSQTYGSYIAQKQ